VKFLVEGLSPTTLKIKAWADGLDEPTDWTIETTDSTAALQTSGTVGLRGQGASGYTGGASVRWHSFECQNLGTVSGSDGKRPLGVASFRDGSNNRIWLAAIEQYGVRRAVNKGSWTDVDTTLLMQTAATTKYASFQVMDGGYVFLWDRDNMIGVSSDYGQTWNTWWTIASVQDGTGFLARETAKPDRLYVVDYQQVRYVDDATSGTVD
jgi:hypothetical protein